jgi:hypothetical protein
MNTITGTLTMSDVDTVEETKKSIESVMDLFKGQELKEHELMRLDKVLW